MEDFIAWHGTCVTDVRDFCFKGLDAHPEGIHVGSLAQARMRCPRGQLVKVRVLASRLSSRISRVKDRDGYWRATAKSNRAKGKEILVYLNRHEGLSETDYRALLAHDHDRLAQLPDSAFRQMAPSATDSWLILHSDMVEIVEIFPAEAARIMTARKTDRGRGILPSMPQSAQEAPLPTAHPQPSA